MDLQRGAGGDLRELALFAGAGGGILAGHLCGDSTVCAVEWDAYAAGVLVRQQNAGNLPPFPVWDDVRTFDGRPWRGVADCVSGGFPCQDISVAGGGAGLDGERSGLWREFARVVREVGPEWVRVENSPALTSRGLGVVLGDLAALGFDARWDVLSAADCGAPHLRERIWIVARRRVPDAVHGGQRHRHVQPLEQRRRGAAADAGRHGQTRPVADADGDGQQQPAGGVEEGGHRSGHRGADVAHADGVAGDQWRTRDAASEQGGRQLDRGGGSTDVADTDSTGRRAGGGQGQHRGGQPPADAVVHGEDVPYASGPGLPPPEHAQLRGAGWGQAGRAVAEFSGWPAEPGIRRVVDGLATGVDRASRANRIRCLGNGQVSRVAAAAWVLLADEMMAADHE